MVLGAEFVWTWTAVFYCVPTALVLASAELAAQFQLSPWSRRSFAGWWALGVGLDGVAALTSLFLVYRIEALQVYDWLDTDIGWVTIGLMSTLLVRANLIEIPFDSGAAPRFGVGFGAVYLPFRSLVDVRLHDESFLIREGRLEVARQFYLDEAKKASDPRRAGDRLVALALRYAKARNGGNQESIRWSGDLYQRVVDAVAVAGKNRDQELRLQQVVAVCIEYELLSPLGVALGRLPRSAGSG